MIVTTGFGYFTKDGKIVDKYVLPIGEHPLVGYDFVECATKEEWNAVEVWTPTPSPMETFSPKRVIEVVNAQLTIAQRNRLIPYMAGLQAYMEYKFEDGTRNFRDAKLSLEDLNSDQRVTDAELALIKGAISAQGINLDEF